MTTTAPSDPAVTPPAGETREALVAFDPSALEARITAWLDSDQVLDVEAALELAVEQAPLIDIRTEDDYRRAVHSIATLASARDDARAFWTQFTGPAFRAHRLLTAAQAEQEKAANDRETELRARTGNYYTQQEERRRAEERRLEAERQAQEKADRERQARELEAQGATAEADDVREAPSVAQPVTLPSFVPRVAGVTHSAPWTAEVTDLKALVKAVADGAVPLKALRAEKRFINSQANALRDEMNWPGVRAYQKPQTRVARK